MAVSGGEPISAGNVKAILDAWRAEQDEIENTYAYVSASMGTFEVISSSHIDVTLPKITECRMEFESAGTYQVEASGLTNFSINDGEYLRDTTVKMRAEQGDVWNVTCGSSSGTSYLSVNRTS